MGISSVLGTGALVPAGYGFRNLIINGAMQVHQRGTSATGKTGDGFYTADRWRSGINLMGTWTQTIENDAPTGSGFRKSVKMLCTTADASPASGDYVDFEQKFEGQNMQMIKKGTSSAQQLTLSFWVKSNVTGTFVVALYDSDNTRACSKQYTISSSATWEYKTIVFPADTTGALDNDNNLSLEVNFALGAGSSWTSGSLQSTWGSYTQSGYWSGQTNVAAATNNYWQITGVQLEVGPVATAYEFKPINVELAQCQRYYHVVGTGDLHGSFYGGSASMLFTHLPTTMRVAPTATIPAGPYTNALLDYGIAFRTPSIVQTQSSTTNNYAIVAYNDITYTYIPTTWYGPNIQLSAEL